MQLRHSYTFIQDIQRCCDNKDYDGIINEIIPILDELICDTDCSIRVATLNQFEYIANVRDIRPLNSSSAFPRVTTSASTS